MSYILFGVPVLCDGQLSHQRFGGRSGSPGMLDFSFFVIFASRFIHVYIVSPCSSSNSSSFHDIVADVFVVADCCDVP
jgi:hypothetical protein